MHMRCGVYYPYVGWHPESAGEKQGCFWTTKKMGFLTKFSLKHVLFVVVGNWEWK